MNKNLHVINHPLLRHKIGYLRDKTTHSNEFREIVKEISKVLAYEVMKDWNEFEKVSIETPIAQTNVDRIINPPVVVAIMRAGNGMLDPILSMIPFASAGHLGIYRDKFIHTTVEYYFKLPKDIKNKTIILCDPLIASGDTVLAGIERLKCFDIGKIKLLSLIVSEDAYKKISTAYPDIEIYCVALEKEVNSDGYLVPGLGDAGDRLFGTK